MCRLMTTQLEEALKGFPLYSQDGKGKDAICRAIFALGGVRWFILEGEKEGNDTIPVSYTHLAESGRTCLLPDFRTQVYMWRLWQALRL